MSNHTPPEDLLDNFLLGMDRIEQWPGWIDNNEIGDRTINLGAGRKQIEDSLALDADRGWFAADPIPCHNGSIATIYAYHFFEHLTKDELLHVLRECERVLVRGGVINIVVPHWSAEIAHQDLDHKLFFSEQTWPNLFENTRYDGTMPRDWKLKHHLSIIMGLVQRNLVVVSQLVKI